MSEKRQILKSVEFYDKLTGFVQVPQSQTEPHIHTDLSPRQSTLSWPRGGLTCYLPHSPLRG